MLFRSNQVKKLAIGSVRQSLNYDDFEKIELGKPNIEAVKEFNSYWKSLKIKIKKYDREEKAITSLLSNYFQNCFNVEVGR